MSPPPPFFFFCQRNQTQESEALPVSSGQMHKYAARLRCLWNFLFTAFIFNL